jgi:hypothetical protein
MLFLSQRKRLAAPLFGALALTLMASVSSAQVGAFDTGSPNQLKITNATLSGFCPPSQTNENAFDHVDRTLYVWGLSFGSTPIAVIGNKPGGFYGPVQLAGPDPVTGAWSAVIHCDEFSPAGTNRLLVSTGNGAPFNDGISLGFSLRGHQGDKGDHGDKGVTGNQGGQGPKGDTGNQGGQGPKGDTGNQGGVGPRGPAGNAFGYHRKFTSSVIGGTSTTVLSQVVTGSNGYIVDAKLNIPFAGGQTQVSCALVAVQGGVSAELDRVDTLLLGSAKDIARGVISLNGVFTAAGPASTVTFNVNCSTGGDSRSVTNGRMSVIGVNSLVQ